MKRSVMGLALVFSITLTLMMLSGKRQNSRQISLPSENQHDHTYTIERSKKIYPTYRIITYEHLMPFNTVITVKQRTENKTKEKRYSGHEKKCSRMISNSYNIHKQPLNSVKFSGDRYIKLGKTTVRYCKQSYKNK